MSSRARSFIWSPAALRHYDNIVFDCDGVLWRGSKFLPNVVESLKKLYSLNKKVFYCTNSSAKSREDIVRRLKSVGIDAPVDSVYTSSSTTASFLCNLSQSQPEVFDVKKDKVFALGYTGLQTELLHRGINVVLSDDAIDSDVHVRSAALDPGFKAVVVGLDPAMSYTKCAYACRLVRENKCLYIATNTDATYPDAGGVLLPGAGACVAMVTRAVGQDPLVMGKPSVLMMDAVVTDHGLDRTKTLMVGDRRDTDVIFGNQSGMHSLLVFTGVTKTDDFHIPTLMYPSTEIDVLANPIKANSRVTPQPGSNMAEMTDCDVPTYVAEGMWWLTGQQLRAHL